jgi:hypothetical protein
MSRYNKGNIGRMKITLISDNAYVGTLKTRYSHL